MSRDFNDAHKILDASCQGLTIGEVHTKCISKKYQERYLNGINSGVLGRCIRKEARES